MPGMPSPIGPHPEGPGPAGAPQMMLESRLEVDVAEKTIRVVGPINSQMSHAFRGALQKLDLQGRAAANLPQIAERLPNGWADKPITVEIDSPGGDLYAGLMMYTEMRRIPTKVKTVAVQHASSAALICLVAGDEREAYPHVLAVDHQLSTQFAGTLTEFVNFVDHIKKLQAEVNVIFDKHCGNKLPDDVKQAVVMGDRYLDAAELKQFGFVDRIVEVHEPGKKPAHLPAPEGMNLDAMGEALAGVGVRGPRGRSGGPFVVVGGGREGGPPPPGFPGLDPGARGQDDQSLAGAG